MNPPQRVLGYAVLLLALIDCGTPPGSARRPADFASTSSALTVCAGGSTLPGLDVSSYQYTIDWGAVAGSGIRWAYAKATEGTGYQDPTFAANWSGMRAHGVVRGAYHFFHPGVDGKAQADYFLNFVGAIGAGDLPPMLDWEVSDNVSGATAAANGEAFIREIAARTGKATVIYTSPGLWSRFGVQGNFGGNPLYVANWLYCDTAGCCPSLPSGWGSWVFWQWSDNGSVAGVPARVDLDVFNGTEAQLQAFAQGGAPTSSDACSGVPAVDNGLYCGTSTENGFLGGDSHTLYDCVNSVTQSTIHCANGCISEPPGMNDICNASSSDPCAPVPASANGLYCGSQTENGFAGGDPNTLYDCVNGSTASAMKCASGCTLEPVGTNDRCSSSSTNPCGPVPASANGLYCGSQTENGFAGGDPNTLYDCVNGTTASTTPCPNGCTMEPPGMNDLCTAASNPCAPVPASANGLYCGSQTENGFSGGDPNTLYDCVNGSTVSTTVCPNGCTKEPPGMNDLCTSPGNPCAPVPASANGLYCGSQTENGFSGGDPNTLYDCVNGTTAKTTQCPDGCTKEPPGMNDLCTSPGNPCAPVPAAANGLYCGSQTEWGFSGGDPKTLYDCVNGTTANTTVCPYGCIMEPAGMNDLCNPSANNPCAPVPAAANGLYCGSQTENGFGGGDPNTLYDCVNGTTASTTSCPNGCTQEPPGMNDLCTPSPSDPCSGVPASASGLYCGSQTENGFKGGDPNTLYDCVNSATRGTMPCSNGCTLQPPGMDDYCTPAPASNDPCATVPAADNGIYCGTSTENGFKGGDPNTLYDCENSATASTMHCASGCISEPAGMNDICHMPPPPTGPCAAVPSSGNGTYCGRSHANGFAGGDANTLYTCQDGATSATTPCANGCQSSNSGTQDLCAPSPSDPCAPVPAADNGTYCGGSGQNGFLGGDLSVLYTCQNGQTTATVSCPNGCAVSTSGTRDSCIQNAADGGAVDAGAVDGGAVVDGGSAGQADAGHVAGADGGQLPTTHAGGCNCASAGDVAPGMLALLALALVRRRRRRTG